MFFSILFYIAVLVRLRNDKWYLIKTVSVYFLLFILSSLVLLAFPQAQKFEFSEDYSKISPENAPVHSIAYKEEYLTSNSQEKIYSDILQWVNHHTTLEKVIQIVTLKQIPSNSIENRAPVSNEEFWITAKKSDYSIWVVGQSTDANNLTKLSLTQFKSENSYSTILTMTTPLMLIWILFLVFNMFLAQFANIFEQIIKRFRKKTL